MENSSFNWASFISCFIPSQYGNLLRGLMGWLEGTKQVVTCEQPCFTIDKIAYHLTGSRDGVMLWDFVVVVPVPLGVLRHRGHRHWRGHGHRHDHNQHNRDHCEFAFSPITLRISVFNSLFGGIFEWIGLKHANNFISLAKSAFFQLSSLLFCPLEFAPLWMKSYSRMINASSPLKKQSSRPRDALDTVVFRKL